jgi:hypothetical protein
MAHIPGRRCRTCNAPLTEAAVFYSQGGAPRCPYCLAWYPFGIRRLWIVLGVIVALLVIYAYFKLTSV